MRPLSYPFIAATLTAFCIVVALAVYFGGADLTERQREAEARDVYRAIERVERGASLTPGWLAGHWEREFDRIVERYDPDVLELIRAVRDARREVVEDALKRMRSEMDLLPLQRVAETLQETRGHHASGAWQAAVEDLVGRYRTSHERLLSRDASGHDVLDLFQARRSLVGLERELGSLGRDLPTLDEEAEAAAQFVMAKSAGRHAVNVGVAESYEIEDQTLTLRFAPRAATGYTAERGSAFVTQINRLIHPYEAVGIPPDDG